MNERKEVAPLTTEQKEWQQNLHRIWWSKKKELGLTQGNAGELSGLGSQAAIGKYINGDMALNFNAVLNFANLLKVPVDAIAPNSELTLMLSRAELSKDRDPARALENFRALYKGLDDEMKVAALAQLTQDIGGEGRTTLLRLIAESMSTQDTE